MMRLLLCTLLTLPGPALAAQQWAAVQTNTQAEFRGIHAADSRVVWAAGKDGVVAHTTDGGATWRVDSIPGAGTLFLVGIHARDARRAWVVGTAFGGAPLGRIYHTEDGGRTWTLQYENTGKGVFLDGLAFWDSRHGIAFGDPMDGKLLIVTTEDGGTHWTALEGDGLPAMLPGEAAFAASGTAIAVDDQTSGWIVTGGGAHARVLTSRDRGKHWEPTDTPARGSASKGLFGIAIGRKSRAVAVGGDYRQAEASVDNLLLSNDAARSWRIGSSPGLVGVQYGVAYAGDSRFIAVGPGGSARSEDAGATWTRLEGPGYNTVHCAKGICWAGGINGRIGRLGTRD